MITCTIVGRILDKINDFAGQANIECLARLYVNFLIH